MCDALHPYLSLEIFIIFASLQVLDIFGTVTAAFKATWMGTQMLTASDLPLHVAQSAY